jgi:methionyl-tRNA formyltransferase
MKKQDMHIAFFGTPDLAVYVLEELAEAGIVPSVVVTQPDRPAGRKMVLTPPAVKVWAEQHDIPVLQPTTLKHREELPELANTEWDLFIVAAYNTILPSWVLELPKKKVLNVHPSLLPKLRGPSPIRSALLTDAQDAVGVTIIELDAQVDHGPIVAQATIELPRWPIEGRVLDELLFREGGRLLAEVVPLWMTGGITKEEQNHAEASMTTKFEKADGELRLSDDGYHNYLKYCAMDGWPGTFFFVDIDGVRTRIKITGAEYEAGEFFVTTVIPEGKKEMPYEVWEQHHS